MSFKISKDTVTGICNNDETAFEEYVRTSHVQVMGLCYRFVRDPYFAEEIAWQVHYQVWRKAKTFKGDSAFSSWVYIMAVNFSKMHQRSEKTRPVSGARELSSGDEFRAIYEMPYRETPEQRAIAVSIARKIDKMLRRRTYRKDRRKILEMDAIRGLRAREAAKELGYTIPKVKSAIHRNRSAIRELIANE